MSVMFRRKRSVLRSIINNNEKEGCQVCDITDDLLFLQNKKCTNCREMNTMRGLSRKLYLDLSVPTEEDQRSDQQRILEALSAEGVKEEVHIPVRMLRQLYPLLDRAGWKITVSFSWNGEKWEEFEQPSDASLGHRYRDLLCLDFDPSKEGHIMVGSKAGLYEFQDGKFIKCYNKDNTSVITSPLGNNYTIISSVKYDATGKLWLLNSLGDNSILSFDQSTQEWKNYPHTEIGSNDRYNLTGLIIGKNNGNVWFVNNYYEKNRLYKYNYNTDELTMYGATFANEDGKNITPIYVHCLAEDRNGNIWIGTTSGPLYLSMSDIKNGNNIFTQHKVPRNDNTNYADYLLDNSNIRCIAVDGANQKWFGTDNGVYLVSDDCNTQIYHFDTDNSPLISNIVYSIAVNNNTGKVYFATDKGLCSFNNGIVSPNAEMTKDNVYAYPNPVKPDYTGKINIVGLSFNANIKIVSTNGTLINEGRSAGGSYSWDGCDLNGKKVASGIYMVETATESGEKGIVCKIAIIR